MLTDTCITMLYYNIKFIRPLTSQFNANMLLYLMYHCMIMVLENKLN